METGRSRLTVLASPWRSGIGTAPAALQCPVNTNAYVTSPNGAWLANDTASGWIGPVSSGGVNVNAGGYNYQTTFPLAGFLPGAVQINMSVAADDSVTNIYLNGIST